MFEKKTVLVLGAGASNCHGFPLGSDLRKDIIELAESVGAARRGTQVKTEAIADLIFEARHGISVPPWLKNKQFHAELAMRLAKEKQSSTIDKFLLRNKEYANLGRFYIAFLLLWETYVLNDPKTGKLDLTPAILNGSSIPDPENQFGEINIDWYCKLVDHLLDDCADSDAVQTKNRLEIVTFNYDLSLEHYLDRMLFLSSSYGSTECDHSVIVPVHHVYGSLDNLLSDQIVGRNDFGRMVAKAALNSVENIQIIDRNEITPDIKKVHNALGQAEQIIFIGFGFAPENNALLDLPRHLKASSVHYHQFTETQRITDVINVWKNNHSITGRVVTGHIFDAIEDGALLGNSFPF